MILWSEEFNPNVIRGPYEKRKTCRRGHTYNEENTYYDKLKRNGKTYPIRVCRLCRVLRDRKRRPPLNNHDRSPIERTPCN